MPWVLVRHTVKDYKAWRPVFDQHVPKIKQYSGKKGMVLHSDGDPNDVWVAIEVDDLSKARGFLQSAELRASMEQSGVVGAPQISFLQQLPPPPL